MSKSIHLFLLVLLTTLTLCFSSSAQAPQAIPYQAVARDNSGAALANQTINLQLSIHDVFANGIIVYQETQTTTTNSFGLFTLNIGQGTPLIGTIDGVNWSSGSKFIQIEFDPAGGTTYTDMGTTQLMSVPYALSSGDNQWFKNGSDISNTNDGNVGIGTNYSPAKLSVTAVTGTALRLVVGGTQEALSISGEGEMNIDAPNIVGGRMTVKNNGDVGIGTYTPVAKLDVAGNLRLADGTQGQGKFLKSDAYGIASWDTLNALDVLNSPFTPNLSCPNLLGVVTTSPVPRSVAVSKNYAYVIHDSHSFTTFDVSDPLLPILSSSFVSANSLNSIALSGDYAYTIGYGSLSVYHIVNPATPSFLSSVSTGTDAREIVVSGNYAYVTTAFNSLLQVFNISSPASPTLVGSVSIGGVPTSLAVSGDYAYVGTSGSNLKVFNINNSTSPTLVGSTNSMGIPRSLAVSGDYAYVVSSSNLNVFNISNPALPTLISSVITGGASQSVLVSDKLAYVLNSSNIRVFNITNPTSPIVVDSAVTANNSRSIAVSGNYAYVVNQVSNTLQIFNLKCDQNFNVTINSITGQTIAVESPWNSMGQDISSTNSGNVGIGTTTPNTKLDVNGEIRTNQEGNSLSLVGSNNTATGVAIVFNKQAANANWYANLGVKSGMFTLSSLTSDLFKVDLQNGGATIYRGLLSPRIAVNSNLTDLTNDAPWYGIGYSNLTLPNQSQPATQVSGYWGLNFIDRGGNMVFSNGKLGIGTNNPQAPLHINTTANVSPGAGYLFGASGLGGSFNGVAGASIWASGTIIASNFYAVSDERIKNIIGIWNSGNDLKLLNKIKVTDYSYVDRLIHGTKIVKKVIAQQIEEVLPNAVSKSTNFIPNVYALSTRTALVNGKLQITISKDHKLKVGDKLKWIDEKEQEQQSFVTAVINAKTFEIDYAQLNEIAFVYGIEVNDFRTVDYEAIAMLNVSATQELLKRIEFLEKENEQLKEMNASNNAKISTIEAKLNLLFPAPTTITAQK